METENREPWNSSGRDFESVLAGSMFNSSNGN